MSVAYAQTPAPTAQKPATPPSAPAQPAKPAPAPSPAPPSQPQKANPAAAQPSAPPVAAPVPAPPTGSPAAPGQAAPPAPAAAAPAPAAPAPQPEAYTYNADGRRDPFTSLIGTGASDVRAPGSRRGDGPGVMAVADVSVRGIMQSRGALVAMIQGPDNKTYIVHQGDKFLDGTIKTITPQGLVVIQDVNDPLSLVKQREVSKLLRSLEVVKP
ncbi:MAG TPA: hypothetical protein VH583_26325 [Vicinamibacterales bacterium]|jgi:Tfp pilus assembly protein PilP